MKIDRVFGLALMLLLMCFKAFASQTSYVIDVPAYASGSYDAFGESDPRNMSGVAGFGALGHVHGPARSYAGGCK